MTTSEAVAQDEVILEINLICQKDREHGPIFEEKVVHHSKWWRVVVTKAGANHVAVGSRVREGSYVAVRTWGRIGAKTMTDKKPRVSHSRSDILDWAKKEAAKKINGPSAYRKTKKQHLTLLQSITAALSKKVGGTGVRLNLFWAWVHPDGRLEYLPLSEWTEIPESIDVKPGILIGYDRHRGEAMATQILFLAEGAYNAEDSRQGGPVKGREAEVAEAVQEAIAESGVV